MKRGRIDFIKFIRKNVLYIFIGILGSAIISMTSLYMALRTGAYVLPCLFSAAVSVLFSYAIAAKRDISVCVMIHSALVSGSMLSAVLATVLPELIVEKTVSAPKVPTYFPSAEIYGFDDFFAKKKQFADSFKQATQDKVEGSTLSELTVPCIFVLLAVLLLAFCFTWIKRDAYVRRKECDFPEGLAASMIISGTGPKQTVSRKAVYGAFTGAGFTAAREIALRAFSSVGNKSFLKFTASPLFAGLGYIAGFKRSLMMLAGAVFSYVATLPFMFDKENSLFGGADFARFEIGVGLLIGAGIGTMLDMFISRLEARERRIIDGYTDVVKTSFAKSVANNLTVVALLILVYLFLSLAGIPTVYGLLLVAMGYIACHVGASVKGESGVMTVSVPASIGALAIMTLDTVFGLDVKQMFISVLFVAAVCAMAGSLTDSYKVGMRLAISPKSQLAMHIIGGVVGAASALLGFFILANSDMEIAQNAVTLRGIFAYGIDLKAIWLPAALSAALVLLKLPAASFAIGAFLRPFYSLSFFFGGLVRFINIRRKNKTDFNIAMGLGVGESVALCLIAIISWIFGV